MISLSGRFSAFIRSMSVSRPRCQVVITVNNAAPASRGNHPPSSTLLTLLDTKTASTMASGPITTAVVSGFQCHKQWVMKYMSSVVRSIVDATAMPYADARLSDDLKNTTRNTTAANSDRLMNGTKTCPISCVDVWTMGTRGKKPSCTACLVIENAPEITAWDAMMVAAVARMTSGKSAQPGADSKNGCCTVSGFMRTRAA